MLQSQAGRAATLEDRWLGRSRMCMLLKNRRIFIVEDNAAYVAIASIYLRYEGAVVESERWGLKVPEIILQHLPIDVILMDLMLPRNTSGFEVFDQIRQVPQLAAIPIVAVSAADPEIVMPQARERGFAGFISKPISRSFVQHVATVLQGKPVWNPDSWQYWSNA